MLHAKGIMPVLRVSDMQKAVDWYTDRLGFELCWRKPADGGGENCLLRAGAATLMLSTGQHLGDKPALTGTLYFNVEEVAGLYDSVKNHVDLVWPLETMDYGAVEFGIRDSDSVFFLAAFRIVIHGTDCRTPTGLVVAALLPGPDASRALVPRSLVSVSPAQALIRFHERRSDLVVARKVA